MYYICLGETRICGPYTHEGVLFTWRSICVNPNGTLKDTVEIPHGDNSITCSPNDLAIMPDEEKGAWQLEREIAREVMLCPNCKQKVHTTAAENVPAQSLRCCNVCGEAFFIDFDSSPVDSPRNKEIMRMALIFLRANLPDACEAFMVDSGNQEVSVDGVLIQTPSESEIDACLKLC